MSWADLFRDLAVARVARDHQLSYFDIGTRGGFQDDLAPLGFAVDAVGFEPEPEEFARLAAATDPRWASARVVQQGISPEGGVLSLHMPTENVAASLLTSDEDLGRRFNKTEFFDAGHALEIETVTLASAVRDAGVANLDYLKIDVEGAEYGIFAAAGDVMANVLAIKTEACWLPARTGQALAGDLDRLLTDQGFQLMDIVYPAHWRREGDVADPLVAATSPPYSRGQLIHADLLYFRDPATLAERPDAAVRMALIAMAMGYFDHALMLLEAPDISADLEARYGTTVRDMVDAASRAYGRRAFGRAFRAQLRGLARFLRHLGNALR